MGITLVLEESNFVGYIPNDSEYLAQVVDIAVREVNFKDGDTARRLNFKFKLISDDPHNGDELYGQTSTAFTDHPNCRLFKWAEALLGLRLPPHYQLNSDDLIDRRCRVVIEYGTYEKNGQRQEYNRVKDVKPTKASADNMATQATNTDYDEF